MIDELHDLIVEVSILTRPEGRVQLSDLSVKGSSYPVSIFTRPEGRVQRKSLLLTMLSMRFQSSPAPKDGCNRTMARQLQTVLPVSILTRPEGRVQLFL